MRTTLDIDDDVLAAAKELAGHHNLRDEDTIDIMASIATGMRGKRLRYRELIAPSGLPSGARSV